MERNFFQQEIEKIFAATQKLIDAGRFHSASVGEIAFYAGMSETTLRVLFRSKEEIVVELASKTEE